MIYYVKFNKDDINKVYEIIKKMEDFYFTGGIFYISTKQSLEKIRKVFDGFKVMIAQIDVDKPPQVISAWVKKILTKEEIARFEKENKIAIKSFMKLIDDVREDLDKQLKEGGIDGGNQESDNA